MNADDEYPLDDPDTFMGTCPHCGREAPLQIRQDPFVGEGISEPYEDDTYPTCWPCYEKQCDEI